MRLTVLCCVYAIGHISGCHLNPVVSIGLSLTLVHLLGIPITNLSVNPARSIGPALFVGGCALVQLWMFWVAPIVGAVLAGGLSGFLDKEEPPAKAA